MSKRKTYTREFKLKVINDRNNGLPLNKVANKYERNTTQVSVWTKKYNELGEESFIDRRGKHK